MPLATQIPLQAALPLEGGVSGRRLSRMLLPGFLALIILLLVPVMIELLVSRGIIQTVPNLQVRPVLLSFKALADASIGAAYVAMAALLRRFSRRTAFPIPFLQVFSATGFFILGSTVIRFTLGLTSSVDVAWLSILVQYVMAVVAVGSVFALIPLMPRIVELIQSARQTHAARGVIERQNEELRQTNVKAYENLERLRALIDSLPLGAIATDQHRNVIHANDRFCRLFDLRVPYASLIGMSYAKVSELKQRGMADPSQAWSMDTAVATGKEAVEELIQLQDGRVISRDAVPINLHGEYRGHLLLYRDATKEHRVNKAKSEFMSLASHQLRTPLTILKWSYGRLQKKLEDKIDDADAKILREARAATNRMGHTIDTMLAIARIEAGTVRAETLEMKLGQTLQEIRTAMGPSYQAKKQSVSIECPPNIVMRTDPFIFREILQNLLTNAIKYTPDKGAIVVRADIHDGKARIHVEDNGCGIPENQHSRIFHKFFRGDNVVQNDTEGTGLGLYLVHLLTKMLRGSVSFVSQEGKGTIFTLAFPLSIEESAQQPVG